MLAKEKDTKSDTPCDCIWLVTFTWGFGEMPYLSPSFRNTEDTMKHQQNLVLSLTSLLVGQLMNP